MILYTLCYDVLYHFLLCSILLYCIIMLSYIFSNRLLWDTSTRNVAALGPQCQSVPCPASASITCHGACVVCPEKEKIVDMSERKAYRKVVKSALHFEFRSLIFFGMAKNRQNISRLVPLLHEESNSWEVLWIHYTHISIHTCNIYILYTHLCTYMCVCIHI